MIFLRLPMPRLCCGIAWPSLTLLLPRCCRCRSRIFCSAPAAIWSTDFWRVLWQALVCSEACEYNVVQFGELPPPARCLICGENIRAGLHFTTDTASSIWRPSAVCQLQALSAGDHDEFRRSDRRSVNGCHIWALSISCKFMPVFGVIGLRSVLRLCSCYRFLVRNPQQAGQRRVTQYESYSLSGITPGAV